MSLPEIDTNSQLFTEYWETEEEIRFICPVCDKKWPEHAVYYPIDKLMRPICKKHKAFHETYRILEQLEHELLGDQFNALSVTLKLSEERII